MPISLAQQIEEVERELSIRDGVYARRVSSGKMRKALADYHIERMRAVLQTLQELEARNAKAAWAKMKRDTDGSD
jgi:hypothetical protein